jgi:hypothetical protein
VKLIRFGRLEFERDGKRNSLIPDFCLGKLDELAVYFLRKDYSKRACEVDRDHEFHLERIKFEVHLSCPQQDAR